MTAAALVYSEMTALDCHQMGQDTGYKYEWMDGQIFAKAGDEAMEAAVAWMSARGFVTRVVAMAGATFTHNRLSANLMRVLGNQLQGKPCEPLGSDMKVRVQETGVNAFPDVMVSCPPQEWDETVPNTLLNPTVIIEILSPSTQAYDRDAKWDSYRHLPSLQDYLLVSSDRAQIQHLRRQFPESPERQEWLMNFAEARDATVRLDSVDCELLLSEVYERIAFDND